MSALDDFDGLLRWPALSEWIAAQGDALPGTGPVAQIEPLSGGSQNHLFVVTRTNGRFVLRRPPRHLRTNSNETMRREARLLTALGPTDVRHPRLYASCSDETVIGVCFYAMEAVDGFSPSRGLPPRYASDTAWLRTMAFELVDGVATLGLVDPMSIGLGNFGKSERWVERQVARWRSQLESYRELEGYGAPDIPGVDQVGRWLEANRPAEHEARIGIIHGDCQWANVIFDHDQPRLNAFIDWELATLGDPLLDLGSILSSWNEPGDPPRSSTGSMPYSSMPGRAELIDRYLERTGRDRALVLWFSVLACYKLGIILEGTWARALAGKAPRATGEMLHAVTLWCFARAQQLIHVSR